MFNVNNTKIHDEYHHIDQSFQICIDIQIKKFIFFCSCCCGWRDGTANIQYETRKTRFKNVKIGKADSGGKEEPIVCTVHNVMLTCNGCSSEISIQKQTILAQQTIISKLRSNGFAID